MAKFKINALSSIEMTLILPGGTFSEFVWKPPPIIKARHRRKHNKSFTGCIACKQRKVRCSQEKPTCARCHRTNAECEYRALKVWLFKPEEPKAATKSQPLLCLPPPQSSLKPSSRRALSYYKERAAPIFSAYFGKSFFNTLILQMSHNEPIVRDALIGAAIIVESVESQDPADRCRLRAEFYTIYNKAIGVITSSSNSPSSEAVVTACVLFACYEMVNGSIEYGIAHVRAGLNIAQSRLTWLADNEKLNNPEGKFLREQMQPIMAGFATQAYIYGTDLLPPKQIAEIASEHYELPYIPDTFANIYQAHHCLSGVIHHIAVTRKYVGCAYDWEHIRVLEGLLSKWTCAFDQYEEELDVKHRPAQRMEVTALRCNLGVAIVVLKALKLGVNQLETTTDVFSEDFSAILHLYLGMGPDTYQNQDTIECGATSSLVEFIPPLFIVAITTSSDQQQAVATWMLESMNRKEANWSSGEAAGIAKRIIHTRAGERPELDPTNLSTPEYGVVSTCLHTASIQWSLSHCVTKICHDSVIRSIFESCICRQEMSLSGT